MLLLLQLSDTALEIQEMVNQVDLFFLCKVGEPGDSKAQMDLILLIPFIFLHGPSLNSL